MKCKQFHPEFELGSLIPFPMMISVMFSMPPFFEDTMQTKIYKRNFKIRNWNGNTWYKWNLL